MSEYSVCLADQSGVDGRGGGGVVVARRCRRDVAGGVSKSRRHPYTVRRKEWLQERCTGCMQGHYMPLLPNPTTVPMSMQQAMASTTCVLQVPRTASTASAAHATHATLPGTSESEDHD